MRKQKQCLNPQCPNDADGGSRGLCKACYAVGLTMVRKKKTTWEKLEACGRALTAAKTNPQWRFDWFLQRNPKPTQSVQDDKAS